jgi:hypothetical protein
MATYTYIIDPQARHLFDEAGWIWHNSGVYIETRNPVREPTSEYRSRPKHSISYDQLRDHDLAGDGPKPNPSDGLEWLRILLGLNK